MYSKAIFDHNSHIFLTEALTKEIISLKKTLLITNPKTLLDKYNLGDLNERMNELPIQVYLSGIFISNSFLSSLMNVNTLCYVIR